jgi:PleD family two-component response regulator
MTEAGKSVMARIQRSEVSASRILAIDDEVANLDLLRGLLLREGYAEVRCLSDASKATDVFLESQPDIVLLDLMMPQRDGYAVLESLSRLVPPDDFVPIIVLTADTSVSARRRALSLGARDFISKPFDLIEVALRIANLLEMRMLYQRLRSGVATA